MSRRFHRLHPVQVPPTVMALNQRAAEAAAMYAQSARPAQMSPSKWNGGAPLLVAAA
jgi:hypothetical protein